MRLPRYHNEVGSLTPRWETSPASAMPGSLRMIRTPLGLRLSPAQPIREQIREAARLGAKGVVIDAIGDLAPNRLSETGRRELRHLLRSVELRLIALSLPTRRAFDT